MSEILLPIGLAWIDGSIHKKAVVTKLTGFDRRDVSDREIASSPARVALRLLCNRVESIGDLKIAGAQGRDGIHALERLLPADVDTILIGIRAATKGQVAKLAVTCPFPTCGKGNDFDVDMAAFRVVGERNMQGVDLVEGEYLISRQSVEQGCSFKARLPNMSDRIFIEEVQQRNRVEANYLLWTRLLKDLNGKRIVQVSDLDKMDIDVLDWMDGQIEEAAPKLDMTFDVKCFHCGKSFTTQMEMHDFLLVKSEVRSVGIRLSEVPTQFRLTVAGRSRPSQDSPTTITSI